MLGAIGVAATVSHLGWGYQFGIAVVGQRDPGGTVVNQFGGVSASPLLGVAVTNNGNLGLLYSSAFGIRLRWAPSGPSTPPTTGGMFGTRPLVADGDTFNVLRGGSGLSVVRITTANMSAGPFMLSSVPATRATLGRMNNGIAVAYTTMAGCTFGTFTVAGISTGTQSVTDCIDSDITELDNGRFAVAWLGRDRRVWTATLPAGLATLVDMQEVGAATSTPVQISAITGGRARVAWVDALSIRTLLMPGWLNEVCLVRASTTALEYARFRTASRNAETLVAWPSGMDVVDGRVMDVP